MAALEFDGKIAVVYDDSKTNPTEGIMAMQKRSSQGVRGARLSAYYLDKKISV